MPVDHSAPKLKIDSVSYISDRSGEVKIGIARNSNFTASMIHYWPTLNGQVLGGMLTGDVMEFFIPAGVFQLGAACYGGWSDNWKITELELNVKSKERHFFELSPTLSDAGACLGIEEISEEEYKVKLESSRKISLGTVSQR